MPNPYDPLTLTPRQQEFCDAIDRLTTSRGFPPTVKEAAAAIGVNASRGHGLVYVLERKGRLTREPRIPRSLQVVKPAAASSDSSTSVHGR